MGLRRLVLAGVVSLCASSAALALSSAPALALNTPASIDSTSAANVGTSTATLFAQINPLGSDTTYRIEYGPDTGYGSSVPVPDADIGSGEGDVAVSQNVGGLQENTVYHFRAVATNSGGTLRGPDRTFMTSIDSAKCPNAGFRTGSSVHLPDCRAYEKVTPSDKKGASQDLVFDAGTGFTQLGTASLDGSRFELTSEGLTLGSNPQPNGSLSVFERTASGWVNQSVSPVGSGADLYEVELLNSDLTRVAAQITVGFGGKSGVVEANILSLGSPGGPFQEVTRGPSASSQQFTGASKDLSTAVFRSTDHTLLGSPTGTDATANDLYQWSGGHLALINVKTDGSLLNSCGANDGWASSDGSAVFFQSPDQSAGSSGEPGCNQPARLYVRINGKETLEVSEPGPKNISFLGGHGSKVLFTTEREQLYLYDTAARKLTHIGPTVDLTFNWTAMSSTGAVVYFRAGGYNGSYYRYDTATGVEQLVASAIPPSTYNVGEVSLAAGGSQQVETSSDGRFFIFESAGVVGMPPNGHDEIYRYDSLDGSVICVSCTPNNNPVRANAYFDRSGLHKLNGNPRYVSLTDDGSVFFQSGDHLVPSDVNEIGVKMFGGADRGSDVYEWRNGTISLISSGNDTQASVFLGATPSGSDAFFATHAQLLPQDTDTLGDIYDAHVGGGFPVASEPVPCAGDACHNPAPAPNDATPSSSTFSGPGNPAPASAPKHKAKPKACAKGKVRKKGKCVKKRKAKKGARRAATHNRGASK